MNIAETRRYYGKMVAVTCTDGDVVRGRYSAVQTHADEPDEPESIGIQDTPRSYIDIPIEEVASIEELPEGDADEAR